MIEITDWFPSLYFDREKAWQPLRGYLEAVPQEQKYKYYDFALEKMLDNGGTTLPWWIVQHYEVNER